MAFTSHGTKAFMQQTKVQMAEQATRDQKVPSLNSALDPMRRVSKYNPY